VSSAFPGQIFSESRLETKKNVTLCVEKHQENPSSLPSMPVLEILLLRVRPSVSPYNPGLLANLSNVRGKIKTNSRFYHAIEDPSLIYIIGQWSSLAAHQQFLASPDRDGILAEQEKQLSFEWMVHIEIAADESIGSVDNVPFDAPVMSFCRWEMKPSSADMDMFSSSVAKHAQVVIEAAKPHHVVSGVVLESPEGRKEYVMLTGWASPEAYQRFTSGQKQDSAYMILSEYVNECQIMHGKNLEGF